MIRGGGTRSTPAGDSLYYQRWSPSAGPARAALAVVHGFGEHSELYLHFAEFFVSRGYAVFAMDLRGHGRSAGRRGYIQEWSDYRDDLGSLVGLIRGEHPSLPVFLVGHSMGGLIAIEYALRHPDQLAGLVAMGPALGEIGVSRFLLWLSRLMSSVWPSFSLNTRLDSAAMSRDPVAVARLDADPMVHGRGTARLGTEVVDTIRRVRQQAGELRIPILIQHGEADTVAHPAGSRAFYDDLTVADKEIRTYPGGYHNLFVDVNWREVMGDIDTWLSRHVGAGQQP